MHKATRKVLRDGRLILGGGTVLVLVFAAIWGPALSPYNPIKQNLPGQFQPPSLDHWMGTDKFGRDIFSRVLVGTRISLGVSLASVLIGALAGSFLGLVSGFYGRALDLVFMRLIDALIAIPTILLALVFIATWGASVPLVIVAIGIAVTPGFARLVRSQVISLKEEDYVLAARSLGAGNARLMWRHVLPGTVSTLVVTATFMLATAILVEASLGFLGLGIQRPTPTWGNVINDGLALLNRAPWIAVFPGVAISITVLAFNLVGDALRDQLDPRLRRN